MTDAREPAGDAVERVARAIWEGDYCDGWSWPEVVKFAETPYLPGEQPRRPSQEWAIGNLESYRRKARSAIAALPPAPASASARALREALRDLYDVTRLLTNVSDSRHATRVLECLDAAYAALASSAPEQAGEFARGVEAAIEAAKTAGGPGWSFIAHCNTPAHGAKEMQKAIIAAIRALAREPETQTSAARAKEET